MKIYILVSIYLIEIFKRSRYIFKSNKNLMHSPRGSIMVNPAFRRNSKQKPNTKKNKQNDDIKMNVINYQKYETLNILKNTEYYVETDKRFVQDIKEIMKIRNKNALTNIENIMKSQLTDLQCDQIDYRARLHSKANTINSNTKIQYSQAPLQDQCKCGCNKARGNFIPIFVDQQNLNILGPGILLLFLYMRAITASLLIIIFIYSLFSFITNLLGNSAVVSDVCKKDVFCNFKSRASDQNKQMHTNFHQVQQWLGLAYCFLWILVLRYIKYAGKIKNKIIDSKLKSDSDFAIKIQDLPHGCYEEKQLIAMLQSSWEKIIKTIKKKQHKTERQKLFLEHSEYSTGNPLKMKSIQIIFNMQFSRSMIYQLETEIDLISSLITEKDNKYLISKIDEYRKAKTRLKQTYELMIDLRKKFLNDSQFRKGLSTTCCIIEFNSKKNREMLLQYYGRQKMSVIKQLRGFLQKFFVDGTSLIQFKGKTLSIQRAPQPSDILWQNCQKKWQLNRVIAIYLATFAIILISFGVMTGLNYLQDYLKKNPQTASNSSLNTAMNYIMSVIMLAINKIMWSALFYLLNIEYNHTLTDKIISQMNKVLFLSLVNIVVLPILSNYIVMGTGFLYGNDGLAGLAFDYHITAIVQAFTKIFDPMMIIKKVLIALRFTRYKLIRVLSPPTIEDFKKGVPQVNKWYEGEYFDVAENYVIMTSAILHAVFFCQLQPFIIILVTIMMATFYFVNRIKLLRICRIPQMTDYLVFDTGMYFLGWVPLFYGAGSIVLSYLQNRQNPDRQFKYIGAIICLIVGYLGLSNPGDLLNRFVKWSLPKLTCINLFELMGDNAQDDIEDDDQSDSNLEFKQKQQEYNSQQESEYRKKQIEYQKQQQKTANNRLEGYYKNSNAIDLLGFEQKLKDDQTQKYSYKELKIFCESFFPKTDKLDEIGIADNILRFLGNQKNQQRMERKKSQMLDQSYQNKKASHKQGKQFNPLASLFSGA